MKSFKCKLFIVITCCILGGFASASVTTPTPVQRLFAAINSNSEQLNKLVTEAIWDQCQKDEDCGIEHYCCIKSTGNRCVNDKTLCNNKK